ncbi:hypothetical protein AX17_006764 [Amanita inopinata Kibby_2008]|nr:hypothetical protein AX17_006764 [Amanita inopinata Kibby_2008]
MANSRVQAPPVNLKERIAALEQRNAAPKSHLTSPQPSAIPQLAAGSGAGALRDKIAKFEKKGGIPVPRGRFGMGVPPVDSGKPRKQGELYGNRIPNPLRAVSGSALPISKSGSPLPSDSGTKNDRRRVSSVHGYNHPEYDALSHASDSRPTSPCASDIDAMSDGLLSPDITKTSFAHFQDSPNVPVIQLTEPVEDTLGLENVEDEAGDPSSTDQSGEIPIPDAVPTVIVTSPTAISSPSEETLTVSIAHISSDTTALPTPVEQDDEDKRTVDETDNAIADEKFSETVEDTPSSPVSQSSSDHALASTSHTVPSISIQEDESAVTRPDVPVISLSPPTADDVSNPLPSPEVVNSFTSSPVSLNNPNLDSDSPAEPPSDTSIDVGELDANSCETSMMDEADLSITDVLNDYAAEDTSSLRDDNRDSLITISSLSVKTIDSPATTPARTTPDLCRSSTPSLSQFPLPPSPIVPDTLASTDGAHSDISTPNSGFSSPGQVMTAQRVQTTTGRGIPVVVPGTSIRQPDYSHFPPTPILPDAESNNPNVPKGTPPTSPSSRFREPSKISSSRPATFHAVVRSRVTEPAPFSTMQPSQFLDVTQTPQMRRMRNSWKPEVPSSPASGELAMLLEDAALLEQALTQGELFSEADRQKAEAEELARRANVGEAQSSIGEGMDGAGTREGGDAMMVQQQSGDNRESETASLKSRHTFRLPLRKMTKHWKSSHNEVLKDDIRARSSLEAERSAGLSIPDPTFLQTDPTERAEKTDDGRPKTPEVVNNKETSTSQHRSPRQRLLSGVRRLAASGPSRALSMPGAYPRHSVSTSSEISSEDSVPVITPPDQSVEFPGSDSRDNTSSHGHDSNQSHSSGVAWPAVSPKRGGISRAASFAERMWNRARTKSSGSTLSVNDARDHMTAEPFTESLSSSVSTARLNSSSTLSSAISSQENLARASGSRPLSQATYKLDSLLPSEPFFDSPTSLRGSDMLSPSLSLPNPHSAGTILSPPYGALSPPTSILPNPYSPGSPSLFADNESWISYASDNTSFSQIESEFFDAFPSVPQAVPPATQDNARAGVQRRTQYLPPVSIHVPGAFDPFTGDSSAFIHSATLPKRTATLPPVGPVPHTAAVDSTFLGRATTLPGKRPFRS